MLRYGVTTLIGAQLIMSSYHSPEAEAELKSRKLDFLAFPELESAVKKDIAFLKSSKLVPDSVAISGWVYEVETGKTKRVA